MFGKFQKKFGQVRTIVKIEQILCALAAAAFLMICTYRLNEMAISEYEWFIGLLLTVIATSLLEIFALILPKCYAFDKKFYAEDNKSTD